MSQNTVIDSDFLIIDIQMNNCGRNYCIKKIGQTLLDLC